MITRILVAGVGGQGTITMVKLLCHAAKLQGCNVIASEIHGMSQRGGVVQSNIVIGDTLSTFIPTGEADLIISTEPLEALRCVEKMSSISTVITCLNKVIPFSIRRNNNLYPDVSDLIALIRDSSKTVYTLAIEDVNSSAEKENIIINTFLLGVATKAGALPIKYGYIIKAISDYFNGAKRTANIKSFKCGYEMAGVTRHTSNWSRADESEYIHVSNNHELYNCKAIDV